MNWFNTLIYLTSFSSPRLRYIKHGLLRGREMLYEADKSDFARFASAEFASSGKPKEGKKTGFHDIKSDITLIQESLAGVLKGFRESSMFLNPHISESKRSQYQIFQRGWSFSLPGTRSLNSYVITLYRNLWKSIRGILDGVEINFQCLPSS